MKTKIIEIKTLAVVALGIASTVFFLTACGEKNNSIETAQNVELNEAETEISTESDESLNSEKEVDDAGDSDKEIEDGKVYSEEELLMNFLEGKTKAYVSDSFNSDVYYICCSDGYNEDETSVSLFKNYTSDQSFSFDELKGMVCDIEHREEPAPIIRYHIFQEKNNILVLNFYGLGIYSEGDDSYASFFFVADENEQRVKLVYTFDSWCRNEVVMTKDLILSLTGHGGAFDMHYNYSMVNNDGVREIIYKEHAMTENSILSYPDFSLNDEEFDLDDIDNLDNGVLHLLSNGDEDFYLIEGKPLNEKSVRKQAESEGRTEIKDLDKFTKECFEKHNLVFEDIDFSEFTDWSVL